jgi:hypothetical protein
MRFQVWRSGGYVSGTNNAKGRKKRLKEFWHFGQYVGKFKICFRIS